MKNWYIYPVIMFFALGILAQEKQTSPPEEEAMLAWQAYATPGKSHEYLKKFVGTWRAQVTLWEKPEGPPSKMDGTVEYTMIFRGRYLQGKTAGSFDSMPFEGLSLTGFDNAQKKFQTIWLDNMGTGIYYTEGTCQKDWTQCTDEGKWFDPITKSFFYVKNITKWVDKNKVTYEMFVTYPGKKPYKSMEILYTRK